jgi:hypothetical protein
MCTLPFSTTASLHVIAAHHCDHLVELFLFLSGTCFILRLTGCAGLRENDRLFSKDFGGKFGTSPAFSPYSILASFSFELLLLLKKRLSGNMF